VQAVGADYPIHSIRRRFELPPNGFDRLFGQRLSVLGPPPSSEVTSITAAGEIFGLPVLFDILGPLGNLGSEVFAGSGCWHDSGDRSARFSTSGVTGFTPAGATSSTGVVLFYDLR
jgi:hypothetical protein